MSLPLADLVPDEETSGDLPLVPAPGDTGAAYAVGSTVRVRVKADASFAAYVLGARVDFEDGLEGSRFVIHNPNAQTTCGCGSSFSV